jgi:hypothetical protein
MVNNNATIHFLIHLNYKTMKTIIALLAIAAITAAVLIIKKPEKPF